MNDALSEGAGRRDFLKAMALIAGAGPFAAETIATTDTAQAAETHENEASKSRDATLGHETLRLAEYAAALRYEDLPADVVERAKDCIIDAVATVSYGAALPWSKIIIAYARRMGPGGKSYILGDGDTPVHAGSAALANGALDHAFELDNLTKPDSGAHPGATLLVPALAVAQENGFSGRDLILAVVAGAEVMIRIGLATKHSNETKGFHAPSTTGPFGGAVAVGKLYKLDKLKMAYGMGMAGSLACGLLEFAKSGTGAMVKRLHVGRAAEGGVMAGSLAAAGFEAPTTILEGDFGFLRVFCKEWDFSELTRGLGTEYVTRTIMMKRFACHITAHTAVEAVFDLKTSNQFTGADVASITIAGSERMAHINNIPAPKDVMLAQFSIPFSVALALYRDPRDPRSFDDAVVRDTEISALTSRIKMTVVPDQGPADVASTVVVTLKDGRSFTRHTTDFKGTPARPLSQAELREKFLLLLRDRDQTKMARIFERLQKLEAEPNLDWLHI